ncbi:MAG: sulfatase-like hydrolase/transferase [Synoicihabitans sp.]
MLALVLGAFVGVASASAADRPNIVLIMADDMGQETLSSYGSADYATPRLDELASSGIRFTQAHSQPLCTPTRVQIMTGQYNVRNYTHFGELHTSQRTFGNDLHDAGYATAIVGKWQLGKDRKLLDHFGFDEHCLWWLERKSWRYGNVGELIQNGEVLPGENGEYGPDVLNDFVLDFMERHQAEPFFVYYPMLLPHSPFTPTPLSKGYENPSTQDAGYFKDMVEYTDLLVGRVVDKLEELKLRENTLVIFLGDNGTNKDITSTMIDGRRIRGGKGTMTNAGTHVPMVVSWPGTVPAGLISEGLVDFSDIVPTLHGLAGYEAESNRSLDGFDLTPVFKGERATTRQWSYCWYRRGKDEKMVSITDEVVDAFARTVRYKRYHDGRFYDTVRDVLEERPIDPATLAGEARETWLLLGKVLHRYNRIDVARLGANLNSP